jgi:hypothetical protein
MRPDFRCVISIVECGYRFDGNDELIYSCAQGLENGGDVWE